MAHYKSIIAYDGTELSGFQRQAEGIRTVQAVLEAALQKLGWDESSVTAAGRTDAGVHARGQVVAYRLTWDHTSDELTQALNAHLPRDVACRNTESVADDFHPRFSARSRHYCYDLLASPEPDPLRERYAWRLWPAPDYGQLVTCAEDFVGRRDFRAFGPSPREGGHTVREVLRAGWTRDGDRLRFDVEADAFLHKMVRRIVGASVEFGLERMEREHILKLLADPGRRWEGRIAPSRGLSLERVEY